MLRQILRHTYSLIKQQYSRSSVLQYLVLSDSSPVRFNSSSVYLLSFVTKVPVTVVTSTPGLTSCGWRLLANWMERIQNSLFAAYIEKATACSHFVGFFGCNFWKVLKTFSKLKKLGFISKSQQLSRVTRCRTCTFIVVFFPPTPPPPANLRHWMQQWQS